MEEPAFDVDLSPAPESQEPSRQIEEPTFDADLIPEPAQEAPAAKPAKVPPPPARDDSAPDDFAAGIL